MQVVTRTPEAESILSEDEMARHTGRLDGAPSPFQQLKKGLPAATGSLDSG